MSIRDQYDQLDKKSRKTVRIIGVFIALVFAALIFHACSGPANAASVVGQERFAIDTSRAPAASARRAETMGYISSNQHRQDAFDDCIDRVIYAERNVNNVECQLHRSVDADVTAALRKLGYTVTAVSTKYQLPGTGDGQFVAYRIAW